MTGQIHFEPLQNSDLPLLQRWMTEPHVDEWWHQAWDMEQLKAKYGPRIAGQEPTHVYLIRYDGQAIGIVQWYRWTDYPEHAHQLGATKHEAGIDLAIGEVGSLGKGIGAAVILQFTKDVIFADPTIVACVTDPQEDNIRSLKAFEKAGFTRINSIQLAGEPFKRCVVRLTAPSLRTQ